MNGLSLFSGAGIGELAFKYILPDYQTVGYVEWDKYCQQVIQARIRDGILDDAPIFGDIRQFNKRFAFLYTGKVDWLSAGFPCQPFSVAGRRAGEADERNMWPATRDAIRIIRPRYVLLENVPGLLAHEYIRRVFGDLAEMRYDCEWDTVGAADVGAPHRRKRVWIVAHTVENGVCGKTRELDATKRENKERPSLPRRVGEISCYGSNMAHAECTRQPQPQGIESNERRRSGNAGQEMADTKHVECKRSGRTRDWGSESTNGSANVSDTTKPRLEGQEPTSELSGRQPGLSAECDWWAVEPGMGRVVDGLAYRVDRLKALGNGWVIQCLAAILQVSNKER